MFNYCAHHRCCKRMSFIIIVNVNSNADRLGMYVLSMIRSLCHATHAVGTADEVDGSSWTWDTLVLSGPSSGVQLT